MSILRERQCLLMYHWCFVIIFLGVKRSNFHINKLSLFCQKTAQISFTKAKRKEGWRMDNHGIGSILTHVTSATFQPLGRMIWRDTQWWNTLLERHLTNATSESLWLIWALGPECWLTLGLFCGTRCFQELLMAHKTITVVYTQVQVQNCTIAVHVLAIAPAIAVELHCWSVPLPLNIYNEIHIQVKFRMTVEPYSCSDRIAVEECSIVVERLPLHCLSSLRAQGQACCTRPQLSRPHFKFRCISLYLYL